MGRINRLINIALFVLAILPLGLFAQNIDSLYNIIVNSAEGKVKINTVTSEPEIVKCATPIINEIKEHFNELTKQQQDKISKILQRPAKHTSFVTPSGKFRIHYDTTGYNKPEYDLNLLAEAADSVYNFEINILGYLEPPEDNSEGGDNLYDIYISNLGSTYGYTEFTSNSNSPSFIVIDNDFSNHYTKGIDGARVTLAHEYHHAIQVGSYLYRGDDAFYYELLSTSMEEFVYDSINDYYNYMPSYFASPATPFYDTPGDGYDLAVWNIYLQQNFGFDIIKNTLEYVVEMRALEAMAAAIADEDSVFKTELNKFGIWTYFTGDKAKPGEYFEEAENYPTITPLVRSAFTGNSKTFTINSNPASNNFLLFSDNSSGLPDTLIAIITNSDYLNRSRTEFTYTLYNYEAPGSYEIIDPYYSLLSSGRKDLFAESSIFNDEIAHQAPTERVEVDFAFPQPFNYNKHPGISFPVAKDPSGRAALNIYTSSMDLVFTGEKNIFAGEKIVLHWDALDQSGNKLPTGVYIYVTKSGDTVKKGKFVIYNE